MVVREDISTEEDARRGGVRWFYIALGWLAATIGIAGFFLPVLPSTVFFLIALWSFSRGSPRFEAWLYNHPMFGPPLQAWRKHRVIPNKAKLLAIGCMTFSLMVVIFWIADGWILPLATSLILAGVAGFILRCPSQVPAQPPS